MAPPEKLSSESIPENVSRLVAPHPYWSGSTRQPVRDAEIRVAASNISCNEKVKQARGSSLPHLFPVMREGALNERFGSRLRVLRTSRKMSQRDMAQVFGLDRSFISDVERGRKSVSLTTLNAIACGLGISLSELLKEL